MPTDSGVFRFVLGGCGEGIIVSSIAIPLVKFAQQVFLYKTEPDISMFVSFAAEIKALDHSPMVLIYEGLDGRVHTIQMTYGPSASRPWGLEFPECDNCKTIVGIHPFKSAKNVVDQGDRKARFICRLCTRRTTTWRPPTVIPLNINYTRYFYSMPYPPPAIFAPKWSLPPKNELEPGKEQQDEDMESVQDEVGGVGESARSDVVIGDSEEERLAVAKSGLSHEGQSRKKRKPRNNKKKRKSKKQYYVPDPARSQQCFLIV